jgi:hypothetical protein
MKLDIIGVSEQLARHLRSYYGAVLSSINCRREWMEFVIDYRESMDIHTRALAERIFPTVFERVTFEEFKEAVEKRKGQINDLAIVEVLEELVANKKKQEVVEAEK